MNTGKKVKISAKRFLPKRIRRVLGNRGMTLVEVSVAFALLMTLLVIFYHSIQLSSNLQNRAIEQNLAQDMRELAEYQSRGKRGSDLEIWTPDYYDFGAFSLEVPRAVYHITTEDGDSETFYLYEDVN